MARGRSDTRSFGGGCLPPLPPPLQMPLDRDRIATSGRWESWLTASAPAIEVVRRLNAGWRLPEMVRTGVYTNGREQGIRITRPAGDDGPGLTVWLAEYRSSDHIVIYRLDEASELPNWADLSEPTPERLYQDRLMLSYNEGEKAVGMLVEWFAANPLSDFAPSHIQPRPRSLRESIGRPR